MKKTHILPTVKPVYRRKKTKVGCANLTYVRLEPRQLLAVDLLPINHLNLFEFETHVAAAETHVAAAETHVAAAQDSDWTVSPKCETDPTNDAEANVKKDSHKACQQPLTFNLVGVDTVLAVDAIVLDRALTQDNDSEPIRGFDSANPPGGPIGLTEAPDNPPQETSQPAENETIRLAPISMMATSENDSGKPITIITKFNLNLDGVRDRYFSDVDELFSNPIAGQMTEKIETSFLKLVSDSTSVLNSRNGRTGLIDEFQSFSMIETTKSVDFEASLSASDIFNLEGNATDLFSVRRFVNLSDANKSFFPHMTKPASSDQRETPRIRLQHFISPESNRQEDGNDEKTVGDTINSNSPMSSSACFALVSNAARLYRKQRD